MEWLGGKGGAWAGGGKKWSRGKGFGDWHLPAARTADTMLPVSRPAERRGSVTKPCLAKVSKAEHN